MYRVAGVAPTFLSPLSYRISPPFVRVIYMQDEHTIYHPIFFLVKLGTINNYSRTIIRQGKWSPYFYGNDVIRNSNRVGFRGSLNWSIH